MNCQGVLALSDTSEEGGGFQCIPELFEHLNEWRKSAPKDRNPWQPDLKDVPWPVRFIPMKAGELLIFNSLLAHGIRPNTSTDKVRAAQYISFGPANRGPVRQSPGVRVVSADRCIPHGHAAGRDDARLPAIG